jgi:predicted RNase H-like HicB family nuclease
MADANGAAEHRYRPIPVTVTINLDAVIVEEADGGYSAEVPGIPGCFTCGETLDEVMANIREAAEAVLESEAERRKAAGECEFNAPHPAGRQIAP